MRSCVGVVVIRQCAADVTWTLVTAKAPWAARYCHASVIDAAGAIYVIGGADGTNLYPDVWVSADKGADRAQGLLKGYLGVLNVYSRAQVSHVCRRGRHFAHVPQVRRGLAARPKRRGLPDGVTRP